jgi:hypothetical protein
MWLAEKTKKTPAGTDADFGVTTIAGERAGVVTRGENRELPLYGPGGYFWMPESGSAVLVIKGGPGGEETCAAGTKMPPAPPDMRPGEVLIRSAGGAEIRLKNDGGLELRGRVSIVGGLTVNGLACNAGQSLAAPAGN